MEPNSTQDPSTTLRILADAVAEQQVYLENFDYNNMLNECSDKNCSESLIMDEFSNKGGPDPTMWTSNLSTSELNEI